MNYSYKHPFCLFLWLTVAAGFVVSCQTENEQSTAQQTTTPDTAKTAPTSPTLMSSNQSELLQTIVGGAGNGFFRGINLGDPVSKIKATETFELFEDSTDHVGFTHETENLEAIDVLYYLDKNQTLKSIRVDTYLNSAPAVRGLQDQFETYLSGRFKNEKKNGEKTTWKSPNNVHITLQNVSKGKDYGLRLEMGPRAIVDLWAVL